MLDFIQTHIPPWFFIAGISHLAILGTVAYLVLLERKVASWTQDRIGPNRVGPFGLLQPIADGLKLILKEDFRPKGADKVLFTLAPAIMIIVMIVSIALLPWGGVKQTAREYDLTGSVDSSTLALLPKEGKRDAAAQYTVNELVKTKIPINSTLVGNATLRTEQSTTADGETETRIFAEALYQYPFQVAKLNIGILFIVSALSLAVYGVVLGGWASNNKYSFLGGLRAAAQMISYEIPLGLSLLCIVVMFGTLELDEIIAKQAHLWLGFIPAWNVFAQPAAFLLFLICIHAEANRAPFDLAEAEQELVGGYHTEYSSMRLGLMLLAEYAGMITTSAVCVALFFGGWHLPGLAGADAAHPEVTGSFALCLIRAAVFFGKTLIVIFVFMWVRWSLPRFRFDQLMMLAWRALIPLSLALLMMTAVVVYYVNGGNTSGQVHFRQAAVYFISNLVVIAGMVVMSLLIPAPPATNRRLRIAHSRFDNTPLPASNN